MRMKNSCAGVEEENRGGKKKMGFSSQTAAESSVGSAVVCLLMVIAYKLHRLKITSDCGNGACRAHLEQPGGGSAPEEV